MKLSSYECHWALLMISHHWLGAIRQQANTWANADPDICRHMASLGCNELTPIITQWCTCSTKMAKTDLKPDFELTLRIQLLGVCLIYVLWCFEGTTSYNVYVSFKWSPTKCGRYMISWQSFPNKGYPHMATTNETTFLYQNDTITPLTPVAYFLTCQNAACGHGPFH